MKSGTKFSLSIVISVVIMYILYPEKTMVAIGATGLTLMFSGIVFVLLGVVIEIGKISYGFFVGKPRK